MLLEFEQRKTGTRLKHGQALQVVVYPRRKAKALIVEAARELNRPVSSFMIMASLIAIADLRDCRLADLVPEDELQLYRTMRAYPKRGTAAKRSSPTRASKKNKKYSKRIPGQSSSIVSSLFQT